MQSACPSRYCWTAVYDFNLWIVVVLLRNHEVSSIRQRELLRFWTTAFQKIAWGGIACFKEKTSLWEQMFADTRQQRFLVRSREKELKHIFQHINERKLLLEVERACISYHPFNRDTLLRRLLAGPSDHLWRDIHTRDFVAKFRHAKSHASSSTCQIQKRPSKRARPLLGQRLITIIALVLQIIGLRISKFFKIIMINHQFSFRALS